MASVPNTSKWDSSFFICYIKIVPNPFRRNSLWSISLIIFPFSNRAMRGHISTVWFRLWLDTVMVVRFLHCPFFSKCLIMDCELGSRKLNGSSRTSTCGWCSIAEMIPIFCLLPARIVIFMNQFLSDDFAIHKTFKT